MHQMWLYYVLTKNGEFTLPYTKHHLVYQWLVKFFLSKKGVNRVTVNMDIHATAVI